MEELIRRVRLETRAFVRGGMGQPFTAGDPIGNPKDLTEQGPILVAYTEGADLWRSKHYPDMPPQAPIAREAAARWLAESRRTT